MTDNCVIVHGCPSDVEKAMNPKTRTYDKHWLPWIKKELEKKGIATFVPLMPKPWNPNYLNWKEKFDKEKVDGGTILIGHSCGCAFLIRWLGETKRKVKKLILVAPAKIIEEDNQDIKDFYDFNIDKNISKLTSEIIIFISNDKPRIVKAANLYSKELNSKIIKLKDKGHFVFDDMGTDEFPELLKVVLEDK